MLGARSHMLIEDLHHGTLGPTATLTGIGLLSHIYWYWIGIGLELVKSCWSWAMDVRSCTKDHAVWLLGILDVYGHGLHDVW